MSAHFPTREEETIYGRIHVLVFQGQPMDGERCPLCQGAEWCRWTGPVSSIPCAADPASGRRTVKEVADARAAVHH